MITEEIGKTIHSAQEEIRSLRQKLEKIQSSNIPGGEFISRKFISKKKLTLNPYLNISDNYISIL